MLRAMLYEAAQSMLTQSKKWSWLKAWAMRVAQRRGMRRAIVALARRLAAGLAGIAGLPDLGLGAHTFCSLIELSQPKGSLDNEHLQVCIGVLQLLRRPERFSEDDG